MVLPRRPPHPPPVTAMRLDQWVRLSDTVCATFGSAEGQINGADAPELRGFKGGAARSLLVSCLSRCRPVAWGNTNERNRWTAAPVLSLSISANHLTTATQCSNVHRRDSSHLSLCPVQQPVSVHVLHLIPFYLFKSIFLIFFYFNCLVHILISLIGSIKLFKK